MTAIETRIAQARGDSPADLVLRGGRVFDLVVRREHRAGPGDEERLGQADVVQVGRTHRPPRRLASRTPPLIRPITIPGCFRCSRVEQNQPTETAANSRVSRWGPKS